jgi:hypothetical protein
MALRRASFTKDSCIFTLYPARATNQPEIVLLSVLARHELSTHMDLNKSCVTKHINRGRSYSKT